ncbi:MAG: zinc-ribbon domain-containing protein [Acetivibrionales bacterium]|jgi:ribosomal protein L40E
MAFFENLGKRVGEVAQTAAKKSSDLMEITKLNMSISTEEDKIQKLYQKIGREVYQRFCSNDEVLDYFKEDCKSISNHMENISSIKEKIRQIKNIRVCTGCGAEIGSSSSFCPKCGTKIEAEQPPAQERSNEKICPSCGGKLAEGALFCTSCGTKVE